ncbi:UTRN [Cervus elaphus hippelaphus]|uniref:UTRN n=1 Tax=Cervus elaphus hippelaphus TaxID=46360 RepID=A0A212C7P1_CEREH|nr:UTRN [Cervus elaphus hippelaphus]
MTCFHNGNSERHGYTVNVKCRAESGKPPISDMFTDLKDGRKLLDLLEGLTGTSLVKDVMKDIMSALQQTNSEKILLSWVRQSTRPYSQVNVLNFTTSWTDGLAFNAVLHRHK